MDSSIVTYEYVKNLTSGKGNDVIIDVREPKELEETGRILKSINIPLGRLETAFKNLTDEEFKGKFNEPKPQKDAPIVVSCKTGGRSAKAQALLKGLGYTNVKNYSGGWMDWEKHLNQ